MYISKKDKGNEYSFRVYVLFNIIIYKHQVQFDKHNLIWIIRLYTITMEIAFTNLSPQN